MSVPPRILAIGGPAIALALRTSAGVTPLFSIPDRPLINVSSQGRPRLFWRCLARAAYVCSALLNFARLLATVVTKADVLVGSGHVGCAFHPGKLRNSSVVPMDVGMTYASSARLILHPAARVEGTLHYRLKSTHRD